MRSLIILIRVLMGLIFLMSAVVVLFKLAPTPELTGPVKTFNEGIAASGYFIPTLKSIELICALALLTGRFIPLTQVILFPITTNILLFHAFLLPEGLPVAIFLFVGNLFLAYVYRDRYSGLLSAR
jgi:putative oxidoreductase